ncbi:hypothetical protein LXA43DRAFT_871470, partial [Ganoderma leucocontextum]
EFQRYRVRVKALLETPRARAALMLGGIIWRIAMEFMAPDAIRLVMNGPSDEVARHGNPFRANAGPPYYDDALTEWEEDFICGLYPVSTQGSTQSKKCSWFPLRNAWESGSLYHGEWSSRAEHWFRHQMDDILSGAGTPRDMQAWKNHLGMLKQHSKPVQGRIRDKATEFLKDPL